RFSRDWSSDVCSSDLMAEYTSGSTRLHMAYSFELLVDNLSAKYIRQTVESLEQNLAEGWPCWSIGNHDVVRVMSRWGGTQPSDEDRKSGVEGKSGEIG